MMDGNPFFERFNFENVDDEVHIRHGNLPEIFQYKGFKYNTTSAQGFVDLVRAKASVENCVIFYYGDGSMDAIMDDTIIDRPQDHVTFAPALTLQHKDWLSILSGSVTMNQKELINFLRTRDSFELSQRDALLDMVRKFSYVTKAEGDAFIDDNNNYTFALKVNNVESKVKIPATLELQIMLFEEAEGCTCLDIDLQVNIPRKEGERLTFTLSCPTYERCKREDIDEIVDFVSGNLDNYLMVRA